MYQKPFLSATGSAGTGTRLEHSAREVPVADTTHSDQAARGPMIPGERDPSTQTPREREDARAAQRSGSDTGTIGGGGAGAHNADPVRATGVDDPTATPAKTVKKRTTKKYER
jgi:hypothetical protein